MTISVISSLYQVESHLDQFTQAVWAFAEHVHQAGVDVHYLPIVNDATPTERDAINMLSEKINSANVGRMTPHFVGRETLYASWNRGIQLTDAPYLTFWNADDIRDADAFLEGYHALRDGANLVDFVFTGVQTVKRFGLFSQVRHQLSAMLFNPNKFTRKNGVGPFFMFSRDLYEQVGEFDEHYRIAGDMHWAGRAIPHVKFYPAKQIGGYFYIHGDNLSNTGLVREAVEVNITFMRREEWQHVLPTDPEQLHDAWETWGKLDSIVVPEDVAEYLWGNGAKQRWQQYESERKQPGWVQRLRRILAARGIIQSVEWDIYQRKQQATGEDNAMD